MIHYFSNGSEHAEWERSRCRVCACDVNRDCPIITDILGGSANVAMARVEGVWECSRFRAHTGWCATLLDGDCDCGPPSNVVGQLDMFGRET